MLQPAIQLPCVKSVIRRNGIWLLNDAVVPKPDPSITMT
jgi:hypothetical protein